MELSQSANVIVTSDNINIINTVDGMFFFSVLCIEFKIAFKREKTLSILAIQIVCVFALK